MSAPFDQPSRRRTLRAWLSVIAAFAVASSLWIWHPSIEDTRTERQSPDAAPFPWQRAPSGGTAPFAPTPQPAASVAERSPIEIDAQGHLIATRALRALFDQALMGSGSTPAERQAARQKFEHLLDQARPATPVRAEAIALFNRYLTYQDGLQTLGRQRSDQSPRAWTPSDQLAVLDGTEQLRAHLFSPAEQRAFFGDDLSWERYALRRAQTLAAPAPHLLDQARQLNQLRANLPASLREPAQSADALTDLDLLTTQWRARQGTADELHAVREELIGASATAALEAQQARDQAWSLQLTRFGDQIQAVMRDPALSDTQRRDTIARLRQETLQALPAEYRASAALKP